MPKNKKQYLNSYLLQQARINRLRQMIVINPHLKESYCLEIAKAEKLRHDIEKKIAAVDNGILSELLFQKYILGRTLEEVGYAINYSKRQTERMHVLALEKFKI